VAFHGFEATGLVKAKKKRRLRDALENTSRSDVG
jgi:hypothetical protein